MPVCRPTVLALALVLAAPVLAGPRNIILLIGDGMDEQQITIARNYVFGFEGSFAMEQMRRRVSVSVQGLSEDVPHRVDFLADSANTATTIATGVLTSQGRVGTSAGDDRDLPTLFEQAQAAGFRSGIVTTASVTDATPAAFVTHVRTRECEGPASIRLPAEEWGCPQDLQSAGGKGSIAEQLAVSALDVLFGGGAKFFAERSPQGPRVAELARRHGFEFISNAAKLPALTPAKPVMGLFAQGNLRTEWIGENHRIAAPLTLDAERKPVYPEPFGCIANPKHNKVPTLEYLTREALRLLDTADSRGFVLLVEGASIDKAAHDRDPCAEIGELQAFDRAVSVARAFAAASPDTLLIVTADHAQAGQVVGTPELYHAYSGWSGLQEYNPGFYAVLRTPRDELLGVSYATNVIGTADELHTGGNVPAYLAGPGVDEVPILITQRDLHTLMMRHLQLGAAAP